MFKTNLTFSFQDEKGSLIIRNLTTESGGQYVCTAVNPIGSASQATNILIQGIQILHFN